MPITTSELRRIMGHFTTGVSVITTKRRNGELMGMTANALTSVSLDPPLILVCVDNGADCLPCFSETGVFTVNILSDTQEEDSRRFATKGASKFDGVGYRTNELGCAVLEEAIAHVDCTVVQEVTAGDHVIFIGEVQSGTARDSAPLVFFRGGYRTLGDG